MSTHHLSLWNAILINVNLMIGAGIYFMPPLMAAQAGALSYLGWIACSIIFIPVVLSIAHLSRLFPEQGSFYTYAQKGLSRFAGYCCGLLYYLGYVAIGALQLRALYSEVASLYPHAYIITHPQIFFVIILVTLSLLSIGSLGIVARLQGYITLFKLLPLVFISLLLVPTLNITNLTSTIDGAQSILWTIPFALFGFWGFESCASLSHRITGGKNAASRAIIIGFFATAAIYTLVHFTLISIMGAPALAMQGVSGFVNALGITSPGFGYAIHVLIRASIITAYINAIFGGLIANSHLLHAMAKEHLMRGAHWLVRVNTSDQPIGAIALQVGLTAALATCISQKGSLAALANLGMIGAFIIALISLLMLIIRQEVSAKLLLTLCALGSCGIMAYYSALEIDSIMQLLPLVMVSIIGMLLYQYNAPTTHTKKHAL